MQVADNEYKLKEQNFLQEQLLLADPKPVGMFGTWAWYVKAKRQFAKMYEAKMENT